MNSNKIRGWRLILVIIISVVIVFGIGYLWGSSSPYGRATTTSIVKPTDSYSDLIKALESLKGLDYWSLTQSHYFFKNNWDPNIRDLRIEFKDGGSYQMDNKTPEQLIKLLETVLIIQESNK